MDVGVRLPSGERGEEADIAKPTKDLLRDLNLLPTEEDLKQSGGLREVFQGPATSVALLEAGATASKWWATGLGVSVVAFWGSASRWWTASDGEVRTTAIWAASIFSQRPCSASPSCWAPTCAAGRPCRPRRSGPARTSPGPSSALLSRSMRSGTPPSTISTGTAG